MTRLSSSYVFDTAYSGVLKNRTSLVEMYDQISSGQKIRKASDDPVQSARILDLQKSMSNIEMSQRYATTALNDLANEETILTQVNALLLRGRTLTLQSLNGTQGLENLQAIGSELNQILEQVSELANTKNSDGAYIFAGYSADQPAYSFTRDANGEIDSSNYEGDGSTVKKTVSPSLQVSISHPGTEVFGVGSDDIFAQLIATRDDMYAGVYPTNLDKIDDVYSKVTLATADIGARTNQVELAQEVNETLLLNQQTALSDIRDLDLPSAIAEFTQLQVNVEAINNTFAKVVNISLFDYI